jgi:hypothetical protein
MSRIKRSASSWHLFVASDAAQRSQSCRLSFMLACWCRLLRCCDSRSDIFRGRPLFTDNAFDAFHSTRPVGGLCRAAMDPTNPGSHTILIGSTPSSNTRHGTKISTRARARRGRHRAFRGPRSSFSAGDRTLRTNV